MKRESVIALIQDGATRASAYHERGETAPVFPGEADLTALDHLSPELPLSGSDAAEVLRLLDEIGSPATVRSTGGRYFGYVNGGIEPVAAGVSVLTGAWDQNVALPIMSPIGGFLDAIAARWVTELLGLPAEAVASFCAGATIANLTGVLAARDALLWRAGWSVAEEGLAGAPPIDVITSEEIHVSVLKTLRNAGFGSSAITFVPTDAAGAVDATAFPKPTRHSLVLLQAGNVNTGHSDPFSAIIPTVHEQDGWVHVDGAFGLWAATSPKRRHLVAGIEMADSWATDAHKWLNAPYDAGIAICARGDDLRRAMAADAAYLATDAERAPMHLGLQMSQRTRAVETWAIIATLGAEGVGGLIDRTCDLALLMADTLGSEGVEVLAPVVLNQVLVAFGSDDATDAVIAAVQEDRTCWAGGTIWNGRHAMRISVSDTASTRADIEISAEAILRSWRRVGSDGSGDPG